MRGESRKPRGMPAGERGAAEWTRATENKTRLILLRLERNMNTERNMITEARQGRCGVLQHDEPTSPALSDDEPEPQSQVGVDAPRRSRDATPGPPPPQQPQAVSTPKKAMAASVPGSEYWLP